MFALRQFRYFSKKNILRNLSTGASCDSVVTEHLGERALLRVTGEDAYGFLQGLMTNDIAHIESGISSMYSMFLNNRGRVLGDTIIYQTAKRGVLFIECDSLASDVLSKHLKMYRLRKKVDIAVESSFKVWAVYNPSINVSNTDENLVDHLKMKLVGRVLPCEEIEQGKKERKDGFCIGSSTSDSMVLIFRDPRLSKLGLRVVCPDSDDVSQLLGIPTGSSYRSLRYILGVGEGVKEIVPGESLPLDSNCDYLHGISFHKGCYIGQELTARAYHTGVIRKRIMPVLLDAPIDVANVSSKYVSDENGKKLGLFRNACGLHGIALLRISEALSAKKLEIGGTIFKAMQPDWWPKPAPKDIEARDKQ